MVVEKGYKQTEIGIIPEDWDVQPINKIATVIRGASPRPKGDKRYYGGNILRLMVEDVTRDGKYVTPSVDFLTEEGAKRSRPCKQGTLTIVCSGTVGIPSFLKVDACIHDGFLGLINIQRNISSDYLYYQFVKLREVFDKSATHGGIFTNLTTTGVKEFLLPIPCNVKEQTAIATALSDMDELIAQTEKLIEKKKAIKQGVMQELLRPKEGWVTKKLDEVAIFRRGSFPQPYGLDKWYDDISGQPFVQVYDVDDNKKLKNETKRYISSEAQQMSVFAKEGTIVLTIQGSIGRIAITQYDAFIDRTLLIFESYKYEFDKYFFMHTIHQLFELEKQNAPGGIIKTITKEALRNFKISYPNFQEQKNIGIIISDLESDIALFVTKLQKLKLQKQGMMQALLTGKIRLV